MFNPIVNETQMHTAVFIDFDNIYITLEQQDKQAAERFATSPDRWLGWLERELPLNYPGSKFASRRILIRRCYLNPNSFAIYRPHFIRSACEVIDCPPLTFRGKTSTDIHMVVDMLETLGHETYFHEFIILSGDADFTPVLLKLRKHARYSAVLSIGYSSPAYRASCDHLIKENAFLETALGIKYQEDEEGNENGDLKAEVDVKLLKRIADRVNEEAVLPSGIPANDLPAIYKEFAEFTSGKHWLGFRSLRRLTQVIVEQRDDLAIVDDEDSWLVARKVFASWLYTPDEKRKVVEVDSSTVDLRKQVSTLIRNLLNASPAPLALSSVAQAIMQKFAGQDITSNWLGAESFKSLLNQLDLGSLKLASVGPGYLYDPERHAVPKQQAQGQEKPEPALEPAQTDDFLRTYSDIAPLAQKIHRLTDMPYLTPRNYAVLFEELARELNTHAYQMTRTSRTVRDQCIERGAPIARSHVNFVLTGLSYMGYRLGEGKAIALELGEKMVENTVKLCRTAQFELSSDERSMVRNWLISEIKSRNGI